MSTRLLRRQRRGSGQSLVEVALLLPLLGVLLIGLVEFGLILYAHVQVANAAREAARAGSLYRSTRYSTISNYTNPPNCASGIDGWSLMQTMQQAIAYRALNNQGCPTSGGAVLYTSLGALDPQPAPATWTVTINDSNGLLPQSGSAMPVPGTRSTVTLQYPYRLMILSNLLPFLSDPIWISKSVEYEYQQ
jgi:Flp pilus assembly protein TadG